MLELEQFPKQLLHVANVRMIVQLVHAKLRGRLAAVGCALRSTSTIRYSSAATNNFQFFLGRGPGLGRRSSVSGLRFRHVRCQ